MEAVCNITDDNRDSAADSIIQSCLDLNNPVPNQPLAHRTASGWFFHIRLRPAAFLFSSDMLQ